MAMTQTAPAPLKRTVDAIGEAVDRLERLLPAREDTSVLIDFLEDDLREGMEAVGEVEAHFTDVLDALRAERVSPVTLLEVSDDFRVLDRLEYLVAVVSQLRRRLAQAAGRIQAR